MEWISVKEKLPVSPELQGKEILILVNGKPHVCQVMKDGVWHIVTDRFFYDYEDGWCGDPRFAEPTHWMEIPEAPNGVDVSNGKGTD